MLGRFGIVIVMIAVLVCTGVLSESERFVPNIGMSVLPGVVIMIIAILFAAAADRIAGHMPEEKRQLGLLLIKLGAVILCGIGAIVVFSG